MLTSKGMAGVPRASQVILAGTLVTFDLPLEGVVLIMGVASQPWGAQGGPAGRAQVPGPGPDQ
jgi:hypothetical protein